MGKNKTIIAIIGVSLILQACGSANVTPEPSPVNTEPIATQPPVTVTETMPAPTGEFFSEIPVRSGYAFRGPWLELYFTDPASPLAQREVGGIDALVASSILAARESIDLALKDLRLESITKVLIATAQRGVAVRVVTESDSLTARSTLQSLRDAGIPLVDDQQAGGLMNNRFIIIDHNQVWTGSLNFDTPGVFREDATMIRIFSQEVAADYTREFDEMFVNNQFGPLIVPETPLPSVTIDGTQVEVLFSPDDVVAGRLGQLLGEAKQSIYFLSYAFASDDLGQIIRDKAAEGVTVSGVLEFDQVDPNQANPNPNQIEELNLFRQAGLDIRLHSAPEVMYHKLIIIDNSIVVIGSYDFTNRAETDNDENVLIIHNEDIAQKFLEEFQRIQSRAQ